MRFQIACFCAACLLLGSVRASGQTPPQPNSAQQTAPPTAASAQSAASTDHDPEKELEKAISDANADYAKVVRNLQDYLKRFPDAPRKAAVYRALVQSCQQIRNDACVLDYTQKLIAIQPDDLQTLMVAVTLLQQRGDAESLALANHYASSVIESVQKLSPDQRPERLSLADWQGQRDKLLMSLFNVRGDLDRAQTADDAAAKDYKSSFSTMPNPAAAKALGDIAEARHDWSGAADQYALALALPDAGPGKVDRT